MNEEARDLDKDAVIKTFRSFLSMIENDEIKVKDVIITYPWLTKLSDRYALKSGDLTEMTIRYTEKTSCEND